MGLGIHLAELIILEHRYRPLPAIVHTLGKLVTGFDFEGAESLIRKCGVDPVPVVSELDTSTVESKKQIGHDFEQHILSHARCTGGACDRHQPVRGGFDYLGFIRSDSR